MSKRAICTRCGLIYTTFQLSNGETSTYCEDCQVALAAPALVDGATSDITDQDSPPIPVTEDVGDDEGEGMSRVDRVLTGVGAIALFLLAHAAFFSWISVDTIYSAATPYAAVRDDWIHPHGIAGIFFWEAWLLYIVSLLFSLIVAYFWLTKQSLNKPTLVNLSWGAAAWAGLALVALSGPFCELSKPAEKVTNMRDYSPFSVSHKTGRVYVDPAMISNGNGMLFAVLLALVAISACGTTGGSHANWREYWNEERTFLLTSAALAVGLFILNLHNKWPTLHGLLRAIFSVGVACFLLLRIVTPPTFRQRAFALSLATGIAYWWLANPIIGRRFVKVHESGPPAIGPVYAIPIVVGLLILSLAGYYYVSNKQRSVQVAVSPSSNTTSPES